MSEQPSSATVAAAAPVGANPNFIAASAPAATAVNATTPSAAVASVNAQDLASVAKPERAEPFAFADFTWLNGNARTKELAMDTKFFRPEICATYAGSTTIAAQSFRTFLGREA
jgi:hypothetical protein